MILICLILVISSLIMKLLLGSHVDDFLRHNGHKGWAKKRRLTFPKGFFYLDMKHLIPVKYIVYNFIVIGLSAAGLALAIAGMFMPDGAKAVVKTAVLFVTLAEWATCAIVGICERLTADKTKAWIRVLIVVLLCILAFLMFWKMR